MSFLFTLLNLRLNRWVPNPRWLFFFKRKYYRWEIEWRFRGRPWPWYFFKELFSRGTENDVLLNLSDGGHFENLGLYALLQRRCRYVIVSDAGQDAEFKLEDLSNLIRRARVDLGVDIQLDLRGLERDPKNKRTPLHHAVGTIEYPGKEEPPGIVVLIKTTLTREEPQDLVDYKRESPTFPDESTGDQFFREPQFESYRKLGELSGKEVISSAREKLQRGFDGNGRFIEKAPSFFQAVVDRYMERLPHESKSASSPKK
jgi:hypothetical protein